LAVIAIGALAVVVGTGRAAEISGIEVVSEGVLLAWPSTSGMVYGVDTCAALTGSWQSVASTTALLAKTAWTDTHTTVLSQRFYRITDTDSVHAVKLDEVATWAYNIQHSEWMG